MEFLHRTWAEIDISALLQNFKIIKRAAGNASVCAVVKANAYGHSAADISLALQKSGADCFAVSNIEEAIELRECGIIKPILILGYTPVECVLELQKYNIIQCVYSLEYATALSQSAAANGVDIKIHIKLDTGMGRIGFDCRTYALCEIGDAIKAATMPNLKFDGIFTHFAVSDRTAKSEDGFTDRQYNLFSKAIEQFKNAGLSPNTCHCCNSAATLNDSDKHFNMCRAGIILYGLTPDYELPISEDFIPVMTVKSVVSLVKTVDAGTTISYGRTYKTSAPTKIATIACGYADGYPRVLSNKGYVMISGKKAPIVGRVCMDQFAVDVTDIPEVKMGDEVILFGKELPVEEVARLADTINYEIVCGISPRVKRIIISGQ